MNPNEKEELNEDILIEENLALQVELNQWSIKKEKRVQKLLTDMDRIMSHTDRLITEIGSKDLKACYSRPQYPFLGELHKATRHKATMTKGHSALGHPT